jgi:hypothetical protein
MAPGMRSGRATISVQRPGSSSRRRTVLPMRPVVVSWPANDRENRIEAISSRVSRSGASRWMAIRSLARSSAGARVLASTRSRRYLRYAAMLVAISTWSSGAGRPQASAAR